MSHLHLDLVGGLAGDMFISALLDCDAVADQELEQVIEQAGFRDLVRLETSAYNDGVIAGKRFKVSLLEEKAEEKTAEKNGDHEHHQPHLHYHRHYSEIQAIINNSGLDAAVKSIALNVFSIIAEAEAQIHGKPVAEVAFHEVGAWDSIADVLCASYLIHKFKVVSCSCSALPLGSGQVKTDHGMLPVPAPATALILKGFQFVDDGISGERITPTGAAILKYLIPNGQTVKPRATLIAQGFGFGTKRMPGISNTVRALWLEPVSEDGQSADWQSEFIHQLEFEIDDQTPEQLASALEQVRSLEGVLDVVQYSVYGKKNRLSQAVRVLADADISAIVGQCFRHTSTLGLRHTRVSRHILNRTQISIEHEDQAYGVKIADRPGGKTAKVEIDELKNSNSISKLADLRRAIETSALDTHRDTHKDTQNGTQKGKIE